MTDENKTLWELLAFSDVDERSRLMADVIGLTLSWQIRGMRQDRGWTQEQLAEKAGLGQTQIARLETPHGILHCTLGTLLSIANAFDVALMCQFSGWKKWMETMLGEKAFVVPSFSDQAVVAAGETAIAHQSTLAK